MGAKPGASLRSNNTLQPTCYGLRTRLSSNVRRTNSEVDEDCEPAKLGTSKRPAVVWVQLFARAEEIVSLCDQHSWQVIVGVEPGEPEDRSDIVRLLGARAAAAQTPRREPKDSHKAPCPCGSGRKFQNCFADRDEFRWDVDSVP